MRHEQLDYLDEVIADVLDGNYFRTAGLSTGERLYVALGASDIGWLREMGYTVAQALGRLDYGETVVVALPFLVIGSQWEAASAPLRKFVLSADLNEITDATDATIQILKN
jgi:hypothetical protein